MEISLNNKQEITKAEINYIANDLNEKLENGEISGLLLIEKFKAISKIEEGIKKKMTEVAVSEASKYPEKELSLFGSTFKIQEFGTKYQYDRCGDTTWQRLTDELETAKKALKEREDFLKTIKDKLTCVDEVTGEIVTLYGPIKTSTTGIACSIK